MLPIAEYLVRAADLMEAEGRLLRATAARVAAAGGVFVIAGLAFAVGTALVIRSLYVAAVEFAGPSLGALLTGVVTLAVGGLLAWKARRLVR